MSRDVQVIRHGACPMQLTNKRRIMSVVEIVYKKSLEHYALINTGHLFSPMFLPSIYVQFSASIECRIKACYRLWQVKSCMHWLVINYCITALFIIRSLWRVSINDAGNRRPALNSSCCPAIEPRDRDVTEICADGSSNAGVSTDNTPPATDVSLPARPYINAAGVEQRRRRYTSASRRDA